jgi:hypothetical protein
MGILAEIENTWFARLEEFFVVKKKGRWGELQGFC